MAVAVVALVFACAGSAVAGSLITGAQIKDGSITGKDIRNRSIGLADIGVKTRKSLRGSGTAGVTGATGAVGAAGAAGQPASTTITGPGDGWSTSNPTVSITPSGVTFGPYADNTVGGSIKYSGLNGKKLKDVASAEYTARYDHTGPTPDNGDAPYFRIFTTDGVTEHDVVFSPSTQPGACYAPGGSFSSTKCTTSGRMIKYVVNEGTVRYDDDPDTFGDHPWDDVIHDHGDDVITGVRVSLGFSQQGTSSGALHSLTLEATGFGPNTFVFGN